jgi:hypothetical protein
VASQFGSRVVAAVGVFIAVFLAARSVFLAVVAAFLAASAVFTPLSLD